MRDKLQQRLDGLRAGLKDIELEYNRQLGAIQEVEYWLQEMEPPETEIKEGD